MDTPTYLKEQQNLATELQRLKTNFGKDGPSRKTPQYLQNKRSELLHLWELFEKNHQELESIISFDHPYLEKDLYGQTQKVYEDVLKTIDSLEKKVQPKVTIAADQYNFPVETPANKPMTPISHTTITTPRPPVTALGATTNQLNTIMPATPMAQFDTTRFNNFPKLPPIKIPKFGGNYTEWKSFIDIFTNVIHDNLTLSNVEKMQYLLHHLEGEARRVVSHLQLSNNNYNIALQLIQARYNNNRKIITTYINTIIDTKRIEHRSQEDIITLYDTLRECLEALKALHCQTENWDPMIVCLATRKLDQESLRLFEESLAKPREMPTIEELLQFLEKRFQVLDSIKNSRNSQGHTNNNIKKRSFNTTTINKTCLFCKQEHTIYQCIQFKRLPVTERVTFVTKKELCKNCLAHNKGEKCKTTKTCFFCKRRHHTLLHVSSESQEDTTTNKPHFGKARNYTEQGQAFDAVATTLHHKAKSPNVLLPTAIVKIINIYGQTEKLRALIDPGSQISLITEEAVQRLRLKKERVQTTIFGVGNTQTTRANNKVALRIKLPAQQHETLRLEAFVLTKLSSKLPESAISHSRLKKLNNLSLADPSYNEPGSIDLLLGADIYAKILVDGFIPGEPAAQNTKFGWILFGNTPATRQESIHVASFISLAEIDQKLEQFWEMDSDTTQKYESQDVCDQHFKNTTKRDNSGRYIVRLPFKETQRKLGNSKNKAIARLIQIENKLKKSPDDQKEYTRFLREYQELGHMSPASPFQGEESKVFYLPHHAVFKGDSTTTKLRVVFDASAQTDSQVSLNDILHTGPNIQQDLRQVLLRWRKHRYVFTADIEKMFRQIKMSHKDRNFQRILWREQPSGPIKEYTLNTVTYGMGPATYLAVRTLKQLADDDGCDHPVAQKVLCNDFYVDDMLTGSDTREEAHILKHQIILLLKKGGFTLRKWTTNTNELLDDLPEELIERGARELSKDDSIKALGIHWIPHSDEFRYKINFDKYESSKLTKRILASKVASIFDPLGLLAPVTITAKLIMQALCKENIGWDQAPSAEVFHAWQKLEGQMKELESIRIPRWIFNRTGNDLQLHGFCDASEKAYAAAIYSRTTDAFGKVHVMLLTAKTRVTPLKQKLTLPRLELCGALLLARLIRSTVEALQIKPQAIHAWCDSEITLAWITKNPSDLETYIANRVNEIQNLLDKNVWKHVSSAENPADIPSRGISPPKLLTHDLWWKGPLWLKQTENNWPIQKQGLATQLNNMNTVKVHNIVTTTREILTCSTYTKQVRVIAYCLRFIKNCRLPKLERQQDYLTASELQTAKGAIIRMIQSEEFPEEIKSLQKNVPLKRSSKLLKLHPFLDPNNILRVGGRLEHSILPEDAKHQILLPAKHHFSNLLIDYAHHQTLHGGVQQTLFYIRNTFWIIDGKRAVQNRNNKCLKCLRHNPKKSAPIMGNLPTQRIVPSPPFSHAGIDYAGPFLMKLSKVRNSTSVKCYIAVFVCMVTKAIHLELVTDLSTHAFLAAYKRFVARRGIPKQITTDNGTNFVGAKNQLDQNLRFAIEQSTKNAAEATANEGTEWKFIPPFSPHFGGLWEAAVKSVKHHLKRILAETLLTYEEFTTVLTQVEAALNSRPIGQQSADPSDLEALTPGHFLIGRPLLAPPEPDITNQQIHQRWKLLTKLYQDIWKRWSEEYLNLLQQRSRWNTGGKNPSVGELVLVKDDHLPPQKWPLGRIVELHPGEDNVVRVVSVHFKNGVKKRALIKLCQLPLNDYDDQEKAEPKVATVNLTCIQPPKSSPKTNTKKRHFDRLATTRPQLAVPPPVKKHKTKIHPCTWASKLLTTLTLFLWFSTIFAQNFEVLHPKPGFYIENLGSAQIKRGTLRLQLKFEVKEILVDRQLTPLTHCETLLTHLSLKKEDLMTHIEEILRQSKTNVRNRRGILGRLLTSIFGVNDEVYTDIEALQHNQQDLLYTQNQQMLLLDTKLNQSNLAVLEKLKRFDTRLSQVIATIKEMHSWLVGTNHDRLAIEVLSAYLSADDLYQELAEKYNNILNAIFHQGHLLNLVSMNEVNTAKREALKRMGPNLLVAQTLQDRLQTESDKDVIRIYGYLDVIERNSYELVHVTPIPHFKTKDEFLISDPKVLTFAINYDQQTYFTLENRELQSCSPSGKRQYICAPTIIHDIQDSPSCVIDEIYERHPKTYCQTHQVKLKGTTWKALMMKNTWLFLTNQTTTAGVFCNGKRDEILLNTTGIIHLGEGCYLKTKEITLKSAADYTFDVVTSHLKEVIPAQIALSPEQVPSELPTDLLLQPNDQILQYSIKPLFHPAALHKAVIVHSVSAISLTMAIIIILIGLKYWTILKTIFCCYHTTTNNPTNTVSSQPRSATSDDPPNTATKRPFAEKGNITEQFNQVLAHAAPPTCSNMNIYAGISKR